MKLARQPVSVIQSDQHITLVLRGEAKLTQIQPRQVADFAQQIRVGAATRLLGVLIAKRDLT